MITFVVLSNQSIKVVSQTKEIDRTPVTPSLMCRTMPTGVHNKYQRKPNFQANSKSSPARIEWYMSDLKLTDETIEHFRCVMDEMRDRGRYEINERSCDRRYRRLDHPNCRA